MILSDYDIKEQIKKRRLLISPFEPKSIQPASLDVRLGNEFKTFKNIQKPFLDVKEKMEEYMQRVKIKKGLPLFIHPGEFVLGTTVEKVGLPSDLVGQLNGRSSLGRIGIIVHATAGFIDPGFEGYITLEMTNIANIPIALYPGMRIGQIAFIKLTSPSQKPYGSERGSKYSGQKGPTASMIWKDFSPKK